MTTMFWLVVVLIGAGLLAYWRAPLPVAAGVALALAVFATQWPGNGGLAAALDWFVAVVLLLLAVAPLRRAVISDRVLPLLRRAMPAMSQTERDALEAGTVWWDAELFSGRPDWNKLLAIPKPQLSAHELAFLDGPVEELCRMLDDWKITQEDFDLPPD